jgi:hypothetical protein
MESHDLIETDPQHVSEVYPAAAVAKITSAFYVN